MRIRITETGIFGHEGVKVGDEYEINGHPPAGWAGKYIVIDDGGKKASGKIVTGEGAGEAKDEEGGGEEVKEAADAANGERRSRPRT